MYITYILWAAKFLYKQILDNVLFAANPICRKPRYAQTLYCLHR